MLLTMFQSSMLNFNKPIEVVQIQKLVNQSIYSSGLSTCRFRYAWRHFGANVFPLLFTPYQPPSHDGLELYCTENLYRKKFLANVTSC